jgi:hypothetical protein
MSMADGRDTGVWRKQVCVNFMGGRDGGSLVKHVKLKAESARSAGAAVYDETTGKLN